MAHLSLSDRDATALVGAARVRQAKLQPPGGRIAPNVTARNPLPLPGDWRLELPLPWPTSVNRLYTTATNGRRVLSQAGRTMRRVACQTIQGHLSRADRAYLPIIAPVTVALHAYRQTLTGWDLDNVWKVTLDCLEKAGVLTNDDQVFAMHGYKHMIDQHATPSVTLIVTAWRDEP